MAAISHAITNLGPFPEPADSVAPYRGPVEPNHVFPVMLGRPAAGYGPMSYVPWWSAPTPQQRIERWAGALAEFYDIEPEPETWRRPVITRDLFPE